MPFTGSYVVTFTGSAQNLSTALGVDYELRSIEVQPESTNGAACFVGFASDPNVTGIRLPAPVDSIPCAPWKPFDGSPHEYIKLSDLYVYGTNGQKLRVAAVPLQQSLHRRREI